MERKISQEQLKNIKKMVIILKQNPGGLWVRELSRRAGIHMETARRIIDRHPTIFKEYADFTAYRINLKIINLADARIDEKNFIRRIPQELIKTDNKSVTTRASAGEE